MCAFKVVYRLLCMYVCWVEEEGNICTATYPDSEVLALCNSLRGIFKLPNLGIEITVAFWLRTEKVKQPNLWGGQAPHLPVKRLNLYTYMKHLLKSEYILYNQIEHVFKHWAYLKCLNSASKGIQYGT